MAEIIIQRISSVDNPEFHLQVLNLRNQLLRLPIGLDLFQEDLSQEVNHVTFAAIAKSNGNNSNEIVIEEEKVIGCIILAPLEGNEKTLKLRQMAISPDFQGQGLGAKLVAKAEEYAKEQGKVRLYLHGRKHAVGFYLKCGFRKVNDQEFLELGLPHNALEKMLI
ncbi:unnamed protein product [Orchesella dallaii]|uniref:N-acetyltransferase domain-containing protein n=1 Tax=Orchesella dallaii TaxID=48710 RepID=A0ABP1QP65_9HEXA